MRTATARAAARGSKRGGGADRGGKRRRDGAARSASARTCPSADRPRRHGLDSTADAAQRVPRWPARPGLVGRALLVRLLAAERRQRVTVLARKPLPATIARDPRLTVRVGELPTLAARGDGRRRRLHRARHDDQGRRLGSGVSRRRSRPRRRHRARARARAGARRLAVVSALGAERRSRVFYNRVKGEMEDSWSTGLGYESVVIARPSLLHRRPRVARPADARAARSGRRACSGRCCRSCRRACGRSRQRRSPRRWSPRSTRARPARACCRRPTCNGSAAAERSAVAALRPHPHARVPAARLPRRYLLTALDPAQRVALVLAQHLLEVVQAVGIDAVAHGAARLVLVRTVAKAAARRRASRRRQSSRAARRSSASGRSVLRPGVSMMQPPPGSRCSERAVVVCMPRPSFTRTPPVSWTAAPSKVLVSVDLPAPDEPRTTSVSPKPVEMREHRGALRGRWHRLRRPRGRRADDGAAARAARRAAPDRAPRGRPWSARPEADAARRHERQVALEAAQVEVVVEAHDDERAVDVADDRVNGCRRRRGGRCASSARRARAPRGRRPRRRRRAPSRRPRARRRRRGAGAARRGRRARRCRRSAARPPRWTTVMRIGARARAAVRRGRRTRAHARRVSLQPIARRDDRNRKCS